MLYKINSKNFYDKLEVTWNCINKRKTKNKPVNLKNFCDGAIKGEREIFSQKYFKYYLKNIHSNL